MITPIVGLESASSLLPKALMNAFVGNKEI
jgi:hypothetical protein